MLGDKVQRVLKSVHSDTVLCDESRACTQDREHQSPGHSTGDTTAVFSIVRAKESEHSRTAALVPMHSPTSVRETCA